MGAVVLTPGFEAFDATQRGEFGFGFAPNVLTNVQFERLLSAAGPTGGHIRRPSDGAVPGAWPSFSAWAPAWCWSGCTIAP